MILDNNFAIIRFSPRCQNKIWIIFKYLTQRRTYTIEYKFVKIFGKFKNMS